MRRGESRWYTLDMKQILFFSLNNRAMPNGALNRPATDRGEGKKCAKPKLYHESRRLHRYRCTTYISLSLCLHPPSYLRLPLSLSPSILLLYLPSHLHLGNHLYLPLYRSKKKKKKKEMQRTICCVSL
jgi:hypothetical protein